jgi:hypothetical protein
MTKQDVEGTNMNRDRAKPGRIETEEPRDFAERTRNAYAERFDA